MGYILYSLKWIIIVDKDLSLNWNWKIIYI